MSYDHILSVYFKLDAYMSYRYDFFSIFTICMDEGSDGNQREFIMSMLLRLEQPVEQKWRDAKNAMVFIRYTSGLISND